MKELHLVARLDVQEGKWEELESLAEECVRIVREKDSGTLRYEWFFEERRDEEGAVREEAGCVILEAYRDSGALLEHLTNVGRALEALTEIADPSIEVFGDPSPELREVLAELGATVYRRFQGL